MFLPDDAVLMNDAGNRRSVPARGDVLPPKQARARATRMELMDAARRIFARDGFENARLEDIAAAAGKTRGALYDHFRDKEDIFFAIFEEDLVRNKSKLRKKVNADMGPVARRDALVDHVTALLTDREQRLLYIEFKLYAIRHPSGQKRLADLTAEMCFAASHQLDGLYPEFLEGSKTQRRALSLKIGALVDGLALNRLFDPGVLGLAATRARVAGGLTEVLGPLQHSRPARSPGSAGNPDYNKPVRRPALAKA